MNFQEELKEVEFAMKSAVGGGAKRPCLLWPANIFIFEEFEKLFSLINCKFSLSNRECSRMSVMSYGYERRGSFINLENFLSRYNLERKNFIANTNELRNFREKGILRAEAMRVTLSALAEVGELY